MERRNITKGCSWSYSEALMPAFDWIAFLTDHQGGNVGFRVVQDPGYRFVHGGSWGSATQQLRVAYFGWPGPEDRDNIIGFRVVCDLVSDNNNKGETSMSVNIERLK